LDRFFPDRHRLSCQIKSVSTISWTVGQREGLWWFTSHVLSDRRCYSYLLFVERWESEKRVINAKP
jgi:hypothetical protein